MQSLSGQGNMVSADMLVTPNASVDLGPGGGGGAGSESYDSTLHARAAAAGLPEALVLVLRALVSVRPFAIANSAGLNLSSDAQLLTLGSVVNVQIRNVMVDLRKLCVVPYVAKRLADEQPDLIPILLECMTLIPQTFQSAIVLAEMLLAVGSLPYNLPLRIVGREFHEMALSLSPLNLSHLCRILSHVVFETDHGVDEPLRILPPGELLASRMACYPDEPSVVDRNHALLLRSDMLLSRLVQLLRLPSIHQGASVGVVVDLVPGPDMGNVQQGGNMTQAAQAAVHALMNVPMGGMQAGVTLHDLNAASGDFGGIPAVDGAGGPQDVLTPNEAAALFESLGIAAEPGIVHAGDVLPAPVAEGEAPYDDADEPARALRIEDIAALSRATESWDQLESFLHGSESSAQQEHGPTPLTSDSLRDGSAQMTALTHTVSADQLAQTNDFAAAFEEAAMSAPAIKLLDLASNQVDVMFVLCSLLGGHRKADAQAKLVAAGIVPALEGICARLRWDRDPTPIANHGDDCECSTDAALKIHFLRLVSCLADTDDPEMKRVFFSEEELAEFDGQPIEEKRNSALPLPSEGDSAEVEKADTPAHGVGHGLRLLLSRIQERLLGRVGDDATPHTSSEFTHPGALEAADSANLSMGRSSTHGGRVSPPPGSCSADNSSDVPAKGLASMLADVFVQNPNSKHIFCVSSTLEAIVRGCPPEAQLLLLRRGLLRGLLVLIADGQPGATTLAESPLQAQFDLLGELIKRNIDIFRTLNSDVTLVTPLRKVLDIARQNLVDSNVFIRSLFLSLQHFAFDGDLTQRTGVMNSNAYDLDDCVLYNFLEEHATKVLLDLLYVVDVFSHDKLCCLNTALLFLFAGPRGPANLLCEIQWIAAESKVEGGDGDLDMRRRKPVAERICELIQFWQDFYIYRPLDIANLEASSSISFREWSRGVESIAKAVSPGALAS